MNVFRRRSPFLSIVIVGVVAALLAARLTAIGGRQVTLGYEWARITAVDVPESKNNARVLVRLEDPAGRTGSVELPAPAAGFSVGDWVCVQVSAGWIGRDRSMRPAPEDDCGARPGASG